jgi:3D (Asp-Asp-Asp) domain-containing protein
MMVRTTAYTHSESDHIQYGRKSAAGGTLKYGSQVRSAAADWSKYPLGTRFMIEGLPYEYVVDDYGSALVGTETIDIYKPEKGSMNNWGVRNVPIRVLEWGSFEESMSATPITCARCSTRSRKRPAREIPRASERPDPVARDSSGPVFLKEDLS